MPWYLSRAGRVLGPIEDAALREQLDAGAIGASDQLARPGDAKWLPAARVFPERFPGPGPRSRWLVVALIVLSALGGWAGFAGMTLTYMQVSDPGMAGGIGLAILAGCGVLLLVAAAAMWWLRRRGGGILGNGIKAIAGAGILVALPALALSVMVFRNTLASDLEVDAHHLSIGEHGEVWLMGGVGRTLAHDLEILLADHAGNLVLVLDNGGGIVDAAEAAVALLHQRGPFTARVEGECASACALLLAAADRIELYSDSRIGLHRPSSVLGGELGIDSDAAVTIFVEHLTRAGFGAQALQAVRDVPAEEMLWLEPVTHSGVLPAFHLLDHEGQEVDAALRDVVLARELLARDMPEAGDMLDLIHAAFPGHAREHSQALLAAHSRQEGVDEAMGGLLHAPFAAALAATTPRAARDWLANLVKLEEQFDWESAAGACYDHGRHEKAKRAALSRANEVFRASTTVDAVLPRASSRWPFAYTTTGPEAEQECQRMVSAARELAGLPDRQLPGALAARLL